MSRYNPDPRWGRKRDQAWASEIAGERPALVTRIQCEEGREIDPRNTLRGVPPPEDMFEPEPPAFENQVARFNRSLREGLGTGRPDDNDE